MPMFAACATAAAMVAAGSMVMARQAPALGLPVFLTVIAAI